MSIDASAAAADAAQMAAALKLAATQIVAPVLIGAFMSCLMMGIVAVLVGFYWTRFGRDRPIFRVLVVFLTFAALADTAVAGSWSWQYAVKGFTNPLALSEWPISMSLYIFDMHNVNSIATVVTTSQLFFAWRVWVVSGRKSYLLTGIKLVLILFSAGTALYMFVRSCSYTSSTDFNELKHWIWAFLACGLAVDGVITVSMVYYIWVLPASVLGMNMAHSSALSNLVVQSFQTNLVALVVQAITLSLAVADGTSMNYAGAGLIESKVYIACVIITLNARTAIDGSGSSSHPSDSHSLHTFRPKRSVNPAINSAAVHVQVDEEVAVDGVEGEFAIDLQRAQTSVEEKGGY
ncbi:hypothetical protein JCM11251_004709 [Rhodosporidiobolus azoricus]